MLHLFLIWRGEKQQPAGPTGSSVLSMWAHPINLGLALTTGATLRQGGLHQQVKGSKSFHGSGHLPSQFQRPLVP